MAGEIEVVVESSVTTVVEPSRRVCEVAAMFGLGVDERKSVTIVPRTALRLGPGRLVFVTGASGGGKSTLLRLIAEAVAGRADVRVIDFARLLEMEEGSAPSGQPLNTGGAIVERVGRTLEEAVRYLALAGINDAFVMLRKPGELSDGQRYRLRLAVAMERAERECGVRSAECGVGAGTSHSALPTPHSPLTVVLADEFGATLDRLTAVVIARNVRKWTRRSGVCFVAATTHDDLLEALEPDVLVVQHPGSGMEVVERKDQ